MSDQNYTVHEFLQLRLEELVLLGVNVIYREVLTSINPEEDIYKRKSPFAVI